MILHAASVGKGPPVVLLHGLFGRGRNLAGVARGLAASHRVLSFDLRNHGDSPHEAGMSYAAMAGDVRETLDAYGVTHASVLGHSMGGKAAMALALLAPDRVDRLLVADIAPVAYAHHNAKVIAAMQAVVPGPGTTRRDVADALRGAVPDEAVRLFLAQNFAPGVGWRVGLTFIDADIAVVEGWPSFPHGTCFGGPVLFVAAEASDYIRAEHVTAIKALFPAAQLLTLPGAGHWLHADQPDAFLRVAAGFFG